MKRKIFILSLVLALPLMVFGTSSLRRGKLISPLSYPGAAVAVQAPGARCTRLTKATKECPLPNRPPAVALQISSPNLTLPCTGESPKSCLPDAEPQITLTGQGLDVDNNKLSFTFTATGGKIRSEDGRLGVWDLKDVAPGVYTVTLLVNDGCGCVGFAPRTVTLARCAGCQ